ncbi:MAG: alpha/beta hydrolase [Nocardioides sp.]|nr:alpha/beta hydrolase [Nocardioides sp.]
MHPGAAEVLRDIAYADGELQRLDIHLPTGPSRAPVLVQIHGGAWSSSSKDMQGAKLTAQMTERGWICVAIGYRLAPAAKWPAQIVDTFLALAWVREHIAAYGGDPERIAVMGRSAGGQLAALAALAPDDPRWGVASTPVIACVPFYGVYDLAGDDGDPYTVGLRDVGLLGNVFPADATIEDFRAASPLHRVRAGSPPFFVLHGDRDSYVPIRQAHVFVERLREVSRSAVEYVEVTGSGHGFDDFGSARGARAIERAADWLDLQAAAKPVDQK